MRTHKSQKDKNAETSNVRAWREVEMIKALKIHDDKAKKALEIMRAKPYGLGEPNDRHND